MKRSAVVASGVGRRSVGCDNGSRLGFPAQCQEGEVSANFALTGFSEVLKAKAVLHRDELFRCVYALVSSMTLPRLRRPSM
jgi:hypothetical protein